MLAIAGTVGVAIAAAWVAIRPAREDPTATPPFDPATARSIERGTIRIDPIEAARAGRRRDDNAPGMAFRWCPPGSFRMGRLGPSLAAYPTIEPVEVELTRGYWMGETEVTQASWHRLMGSTLREQRAKDLGQPRPLGDGSTRDHAGEGPEHPIYFVSHAEVEAFCRKLTEGERAAGRLAPSWEYRLPTEAQWEFACRAGASTAGLDSTRANFDGTHPLPGSPPGPYLREITPVGRYPANAWGLRDMIGNVWEWCRDGYSGSPPGGPDPEVRPTSARRAYRGGCWHNPGALCLPTARFWGEADDRGSGLGFRVALVPVGP